MILMTPAETIRMDSDRVNPLAGLLASSARFYMENRHANPTDDDYNDAAKALSEACEFKFSEFKFSAIEAKALLDLYPHARIKLALYGTSDTEARGHMLGCASNHFLSCDWPTYGDKIDLNDFLKALKKICRTLRLSHGCCNDNPLRVTPILDFERQFFLF